MVITPFVFLISLMTFLAGGTRLGVLESQERRHVERAMYGVNFLPFSEKIDCVSIIVVTAQYNSRLFCAMELELRVFFVYERGSSNTLM